VKGEGEPVDTISSAGEECDAPTDEEDTHQGRLDAIKWEGKKITRETLAPQCDDGIGAYFFLFLSRSEGGLGGHKNKGS
jgi:hypothetical protein